MKKSLAIALEARIHNRPENIEQCTPLRDFEGITVLGRQRTGKVVTPVDRKSRLTLLTSFIRSRLAISSVTFTEHFAKERQ